MRSIPCALRSHPSTRSTKGKGQPSQGQPSHLTLPSLALVLPDHQWLRSQYGHAIDPLSCFCVAILARSLERLTLAGQQGLSASRAAPVGRIHPAGVPAPIARVGLAGLGLKVTVPVPVASGALNPVARVPVAVEHLGWPAHLPPPCAFMAACATSGAM